MLPSLIRVQYKHWVGAIELVAATAGFFIIVWLIGPQLESNGLRFPLIAGLMSFILYFAVVSPRYVHGDSLADRGLGTLRTGFVRTDNLQVALRRFGLLATVGAVAVMAAMPDFPQKQIRPDSLLLKLGLYLFSAIGQDLLFLSFFLLRVRRIMESTGGNEASTRLRTSLLCAALFALYHLPNGPVMAATLVLGFASSWIWYATPNLLVAAGCHAVLGTLLHQVLGLNMRIGPFYWESDKYVFRTLFPVLRSIIGDRF